MNKEGASKSIVITPETVTVYYATREGYMVPVTYYVNKLSNKEIVKFAVEKLLEGPSNGYLQRTFPKDTKLKDWYIDKNTACVDFTKDFLEMENTRQAMEAINSLCLTLGNLPWVKNVHILVEGDVVKQIDGIATGQPLVRRFVNYYGEKEPKASFKVYFSDSYSMYMVPVTFGASPGENLPYRAMEELLSGPKLDGLMATVWPGTELLGLKINNGIATVDLNKRALEYGGGSTAERLFVKSILLTLGQFPEVEKVQILIEGKKVELLPEGTEIKEPLRPPLYANMAREIF